MKTEPNIKIGAVRDILEWKAQGMTTEQILDRLGWHVESFHSERDKYMKYRVRDSAAYLVTTKLHLTREAAIETAFNNPYHL